jgi:cobalt-zinc-cadmium resistance protein CzcA
MTVRWVFAALVFLLGSASASAQLRLEDLLLIIDEHPRVRAAQAEIDRYHGRKLQAWSPPSPTITFHEEEIAPGGSIGSGALREWQLRQEFDVPLLFGVRGSQDSHLERAAMTRTGIVRMEVRAGIIESYAAWFARTRQMEIRQESARLAEEFARKAQLRYETGESSALEASRARAEAATAHVAYAQAVNAVREAATTLYEASGGADIARAWMQSPPDSLWPRNIRAVHARLRSIPYAVVRQDSPYSMQIRAQREAMRANASWRWMEFLPRFEVSWFRQDFTDIGQHWGAELTASLPLWFLLDTRGSIEEHQAARRIAEEEYTLAMQRHLVNAEKSRVRLLSGADNCFAYRNHLLAEANAIANAAEIGYESGEIGYMEYIAARQSVSTIAIGYYDALAELYAAMAGFELYHNEHIVD